jgi:hypothetical protein
MKTMVGDEELLWHFSCRATKLPDGRYRVTAKPFSSDMPITRIGVHPLWELIRILGQCEDIENHEMVELDNNRLPNPLYCRCKKIQPEQENEDER